MINILKMPNTAHLSNGCFDHRSHQIKFADKTVRTVNTLALPLDVLGK
jgi:hypothetical protein